MIFLAVTAAMVAPMRDLTGYLAMAAILVQRLGRVVPCSGCMVVVVISPLDYDGRTIVRRRGNRRENRKRKRSGCCQ